MMTSPTLPSPTLPPADLLRRPDRRYGNYIFDLDGTVYLGDELLPRARQIIERIRDAGGRTVFLSNNPTKDPLMYADKLSGLGIPAAVEDIVNPVVTMRDWLLEHHAADGIFAIGEPPLVSALAAAGLHLTDDPSEIGVVVASFDRTFTYAKLQTAFDALWRSDRAILVTTNPDRYCPMPGGRGQPDAAGIVAAVLYMIDKLLGPVAGPLAIFGVMVGLALWIYMHSRRDQVNPANVNDEWEAPVPPKRPLQSKKVRV